MCVILHAKKKKHVRREEIQEAMTRNNSGFYMVRLFKTVTGAPAREHIRTMAQAELLEFFDNKVQPDDEIVMHARIPSYGTSGLQNVHGWEVDGIQFCHNMSIRAIDGFRDQFPDWKDLTDSEFFFKKLFIPYYRSLGDQAYKDGKFHPDLDKFVTWICGATNKFCFVMPDGIVIRYGSWVTEPDRKEGDEIAFYASNSTYKVYVPTWSPYQRGGKAAGAAGFRWGHKSHHDDYDCDEDPYGYDYGYYKNDTAEAENEEAKEMVLECRSYQELAKAALQHLVLENVTQTRELDFIEDNLESPYSCIKPKLWDEDVFSFLTDGFPDLVNATATEIVTFLDEYATILGERIKKTESRLLTFGVHVCEDALDAYDDAVKTYALVLNTSFDFNATAASKFAVAFQPSVTKSGSPTMKRMVSNDMFVPPRSHEDDMVNAITRLLEFIKLSDDEIANEILQDAEEEAK